MKQERLDFLASNKKFTKRLALSIGSLCRTMPIKEVAKRMNLDWHTVKELEKDYMREQLALAGPPAPSVIGIDEISIKKRHSYRIIVSDLEKRQAIWFGGNGRSQTDMDQFYASLPEENRDKIRLAVMDMWKPFRNSTKAHAPQAAILSINSMCCAIWATPWIKSVKLNMLGLLGLSASSLRGRNTSSSRIGKISPVKRVRT